MLVAVVAFGPSEGLPVSGAAFLSENFLWKVWSWTTLALAAREVVLLMESVKQHVHGFCFPILRI